MCALSVHPSGVRVRALPARREGILESALPPRAASSVLSHNGGVRAGCGVRAVGWDRLGVCDVVGESRASPAPRSRAASLARVYVVRQFRVTRENMRALVKFRWTRFETTHARWIRIASAMFRAPTHSRRAQASRRNCCATRSCPRSRAGAAWRATKIAMIKVQHESHDAFRCRAPCTSAFAAGRESRHSCQAPRCLGRGRRTKSSLRCGSHACVFQTNRSSSDHA